MEFSREKRLKGRLAGDRRGDLYPHSLQFYLQPPTENISLAEFENFAIDRLKLLKVVENLGVSYVKGSDEYKSKLEREIRKLKFPYKALVEDDYDARRKDHISHFILRLAYCQSEDLRRWFIQQEMDLFRYRFNALTGDLVEKFLKYVNLSYGAVIPTNQFFRDKDTLAPQRGVGHHLLNRPSSSRREDVKKKYTFHHRDNSNLMSTTYCVSVRVFLEQEIEL
ncbi:DNA primase large subunit isoform X9 [Chelonia mydas]|uniref:DNA primase large subunit isoform X9 n=1 Tax=Chelonia mydas TaxID=8469 RepID=UPI001CA8235D|nr:DNA primase large subunit isoform X9 [Chelonia mydas]